MGKGAPRKHTTPKKLFAKAAVFYFNEKRAPTILLYVVSKTVAVYLFSFFFFG